MLILNRLTACLCVLGALGAAVPAAAQMTTGVVAGVVVDSQSGVIPGATVTLTSESRNTQLTPTVTNASGDFVFLTVPADTYTLEVAMSGFKSLKRTALAVTGGERITLPPLTVEVGGASEVVSVVAEAALIQTQSGERSFTVTNEAVTNLPMSGRSFLNMALLAPGVGGTAASAAGANEQNLSRLGGGGTSNFTVDGVGIMDTGNGNAPLLLNTDAVQEVRIMTSGYQAEYGRSSGMQVSAVTKSGTNRFRGSLYTIERNSDWQANSWANSRNGIAKPVVKERDWGYTLGGPIGKPGGANKLFFFGSQEWRPREIGGSTRRFRVPTAAERAGDFSQSRNNNGVLANLIRDASTGLPCTAANTAGCFQDGGVLGRIPQSRLSGLGLNVLNLWPLPNDNAGFAGLNSYNYTDVSPTVKSHQRQETVRLDYQLSSNLRVGGKLIRQDATREPNQSGQSFSQGAALLTGFNDAVETRPDAYQFSLNGSYSLNPTTFVEATFGGFSRHVATMTITPQSNRNNVGLGDFPLLIPSALTLDPSWDLYRRLEREGAVFYSNGQILGLPVFTWGNLIANAPPNTRDVSPLATTNKLYDTAISLSKVRGSHTMKAGYFLQHSWKPQSDRGLTGLPAYQGAVNFGNDANNPLDTGFGFANAALGIVSSYGQRSGVLEGTYVYNNHEFYAQDNWKVSKHLTLDYGVRFIHATPIYDINGAAGNFIPSSWNRAAVPALYQPACAPGRVAPCAGQNLVARDPLTGQSLAVGSAALVGQIVPNSGSLVNGVFSAGEGPVSKTVYTLPALNIAPRFGFAYDVTGTANFVIRGGAGLFHDRTLGNDVYGMVGNPASAYGVQVNYVTLASLDQGVTTARSPKRLAAIQYDSPMPSSAQWNIGTQFSLPWSIVLDTSYVGQHGYNLMQTVDINAPAFGAAYLSENQDPTKVATIPGSGAYSTDFYRPFAGLGQINYLWGVGRNTFHSWQTSVNRRFKDGLQFTVNYTLSRNKGTDGNGVRVDAANGQFSIRPDQDQANYQITANDRTHVLKANFVWEMPSLPTRSSSMKVLGYALNDWQLSGILTAGSGAPYTPAFTITGVSAVNLTGTPNYNARIVVNGDPGRGCSGDATRQFNTSAFQGPQPNSLGLESGLNFMRGCADHTLDLALARNIRLGGGRQVQFRLEALNVFNTVVINARNSTVQYASLGTVTTPINLPYDANGNLIPGRDIPQSAGFGVATAAQPMRAVQLQLRLAF
jgi:Carboxypeptidase regulatory-like domain